MWWSIQDRGEWNVLGHSNFLGIGEEVVVVVASYLENRKLELVDEGWFGFAKEARVCFFRDKRAVGVGELGLRRAHVACNPGGGREAIAIPPTPTHQHFLASGSWLAAGWPTGCLV